MNTPDELLQAYTTMFLFLGSSVTLTPSESELPSFCDQGYLRNLPVTSKNRRFNDASNLLKSPCPHKQTCNHTVSNNFHDLFEAEDDPEAVPIAIRWKKQGTDPAMHIEEITKLYARYGFSKSEDCRHSYDHLGMELLFVNMLLEKYLTEDDNEIKDMIRHDLASFINNEMLSWLPAWAMAVADKSVTKCYTGIAGLITGSLEDVLGILKK